MLVSQRIRVEYGHEHVGGAGAQRRGRIPLGTPLQATSPHTRCIHQDIVALPPDFSLDVVRTREHPRLPKEVGDFFLDDDKVFFRANSVWKSLQSDLPLRLEKNGWVRLRFNRRTRDIHLLVDVYEDFVANVALVEPDFTPEIFVAGTPSREYDFRRELR